MSKAIHVPGMVHIDDHSATSSTFAVEPLHSGYGMTLGNSLRRVLLSSIAGAAITGFRVEGAAHEFTTIPGVKEDIVDIMLNLKGLRFKVYSDEPQTIRIEKKGKGLLSAKDIKTNDKVEVVNKDHVIATLDDAKAKVAMELIVETGRGYRTTEESGHYNKVADVIALDAVFTPVLRVRYNVQNTRVGQMTDLDKLIITIDTDGSITPREAFEEAAAILINQYTALSGQTRVEPGTPITSPGMAVGEEGAVEQDSSMLNTQIEDLNLSARTTNALINNEIHTLKDLLELDEIELKELKGFGSKALDEVKEKLAELDM